jgi:hypothetical protein
MQRWQKVLLASAALWGAAGCSPHIGDKCNVNSDCSIQGNLQCDTSQPGGYCTNFNCSPTSCPDNAACVAINSSVPGCPYDDYQAPARTAINMCLQSCGKDSDCRDGYGCFSASMVNGVIVDNVMPKVCAPIPTFAAGTDASSDGAVPAVCLANGGGGVDGSVFASIDAPAEAEALEAAADAGDGGADAADEGAPDAGPDGANDGAAADGPDGD